MKKLFCLVEDDYLHGATENQAGAKVYGGFWFLPEGADPYKMLVVTALVEDIAAPAFLEHGTSGQVFSDGYEAFRKLSIENKEGK